ncbi:nucleotide disphospho-sugar-binding domain-containing protein [Kutzneria buriramensis]|uniref:UDP:flavonoid glycosyltransferase YjiC (YdhE family) n=1 Tax=Kutzneria buriramensis TaxID=1045776 RepID=A0A3E0IBC2_9PSEU|nr:nucleotide disphospho-sugar-binding domain-containing protein [Kutzneria buriramensis]REH55891.1 UDP:flavonoid glycosyltransferase YjiC (YdhE family) [Kutzneria buriramensis]
MRILITTSPGLGHILPTISFAHAARAAGHDVLYATGGSVNAISEAGLQVVDASPDTDYAQIFMGAGAKLREQMQAAQDDVQRTMELGLKLFAKVSEPTLDSVVRVAEKWQPDVIVHTPLQAAGQLAAGKLGVPLVSVQLAMGPDRMFTGHEQITRDELREYFDRHGVASVPNTAALLSVTPPSVRGTGEVPDTVWPMRYVPYNGGSVVPEWLLDKPERRRVLITLGTVVPHFGLGMLEPVVAAASKVDAEFVLALGNVDLSALGELPENVRAVGYLPLGVLLSSCDAAIHHGGAGTTMTIVDAGIPQIVVPQGADQFLNADTVQENGVGQRATVGDVDVALIERLLGDADWRANALRMRDELRAMPSPVEVVERLAGFVG